MRIEVTADRDGYVAVFNVGPTGNLNLLYPEGTRRPDAPPDIQAGRALHVLDVQLTPPTGRERLFALWSQAPLPLRAEDLHSLAEAPGSPGSRPYRATRDIVRVQQAVQAADPGAWQAVVVELTTPAQGSPGLESVPVDRSSRPGSP